MNLVPLISIFSHHKNSLVFLIPFRFNNFWSPFGTKNKVFGFFFESFFNEENIINDVSHFARESIERDKTGYLVSPYNINELIEALEKLIANKDQRSYQK